jgi:hypothetical protein
VRVASPVVRGDVVSAAVHADDGVSLEVEYRLPGGPPDHPADAFLAAALMPAMALREPLQVESPVSQRLLASVPAIQDVLDAWGRHSEVERGTIAAYARTAVEATARAAGDAAPPASGAASFFTAGVDSFYTALQHRDELSALIYVHGFDVPLDAHELRDSVGAGVRAAAAGLGLPLLEVETNVRALADRCLFWEDFHGAALASVALLLSARFGRVYVPATMTYAMLNPLGSHPVLDPLWSTEDVQLVHDGCEATRRDKLRALAECEPARRWLRVCWENREGSYNCGHCEKCLRTQVELRLLGMGDAFESMPPMSLTDLEAVPVRFGAAQWRAALHAAEERGRDPELAAAIREALRRHRLRVPAPADGPLQADGARRIDELELLATAAATAAERDRLAATVRELEGRLAETERRLGEIEGSRGWRGVTRLRSLRDRLVRPSPRV